MTDADFISKSKQIIARNIKTLRNSRSMTQEELAEKLDVNVMTISTWERGVHQPSAENLKQLAIALGTAPQNIYGGVADTIEANLITPNPAHTAIIKVLPKEYTVCCGRGTYWWEGETVEFEKIISTSNPELVRFSPLVGMYVVGDSMEPDIEDGDMVVFPELPPEVDRIPNGVPVVVCYGGKMMVRLFFLNKDNSITLRAWNEEEYDPITITDECEEDEFRVLGIVREIHPRPKRPRSKY